MIQTVSEWIRGVVISSLLVSLLTIFVPEGPFRRVARLTGGLIFLMMALQGVGEVNFSRFTADFETYRAEIQQKQAEFEKENEAAMLQSIAGKTEAYILDKADSLGLDVTVQVQADSDKQGAYYLTKVQLFGPYSTELAEWMGETLGLDSEKQEWSSG